MSQLPFYRKCLQETLEQRLHRNPRYSVRAFAQSLGIDSSVCSQLLSGKRVPSTTVAERLIDCLNLDVLEREAFLQSIGREKLKLGLRRINPALRELANSEKDPSRHTRRDLSIDTFQMLSRWYYYAILELVKLPDFEDSPRWIARTLGLGEAETSLAYDRLFELEMLTRTTLKNGKTKVTKTQGSFYTADPHLTTAAHRRRQREVLEKSITALESQPITERNHSAMTVAIDPALIPEAKTRITKFMQELSDFLESGNPTQVYEMQLSLFSLQESKNVKNQTKEKSSS